MRRNAISFKAAADAYSRAGFAGDFDTGALAVYLLELESDDGLVENGFLPMPARGEEFPILRVLD